MEIKA